jgi:putative integral membrane protein (TIGR02587 family)
MPGERRREGSTRAEAPEARQFWLGLARGAGGALLFSIPMLMTMEMWWLGSYDADRRLALFGFLMIPVLVLLANFSGLRPTRNWVQNFIDGLSAYGVGILTAAVVLLLFGVITIPMSLHHAVGKVLVLAAPAAFGSILANSQLSGTGGGGRRSAGGAGEDEEEDREEHERRRDRAGYPGELFLMVAGAIYLGLTVAPTEEMILIPYKMGPGHAVALAVLCVALVHAFVYTLKFKGTAEVTEGTPWWSLLVRFTMPGYVLALLTSAYLLWTFGRFDGVGLYWCVMYSVTLGLPASVGAASARLVL